MTQEEDAVVRRPEGDTRIVCSGMFPCLLGIVQMILSLTIIGLESASVYYDAGRGTIYAGFWCSIVFVMTSISMFCFLCCGKSSTCAIWLLILNIINSIFAGILIVFTILFINQPCLCYGVLCEIPSWPSGDQNFVYPHLINACTTRTLEKTTVLKALLACALAIFLCNIIFILVSFILCIRSRSKSKDDTPKQFHQQHPSPVIRSSHQYEQPYLVPRTSELYYYYSEDSESTTENLAFNKSIPTRSQVF